MRQMFIRDRPNIEGCYRPIHFILPERSVVSAGTPRAVSAGNVETSQRITDTAMGALALALPDRIPAASSGTMNNITIGGFDKNRDQPYAYYETIAGGAGAGPLRSGRSGVHTHMTNTMNTPIEALPLAYPFSVERYALRTGTGGNGLNRGGEGIVREYLFYDKATVSLITERRIFAPWGLSGGSAGSLGKNTLIRKNGRFQQVYDPSLPLIEADENQLKQVFLNLIKNAIEASRDGGTLQIVTRLSSGFAIKTPIGTVPRKNIAVEIIDSGEGMDEATQKK